MPKSMEKRKEKKEKKEIKIAHTFKIRGTHPKRERFMIQRSTKIFKIRKL